MPPLSSGQDAVCACAGIAAASKSVAAKAVAGMSEDSPPVTF